MIGCRSCVGRSRLGVVVCRYVGVLGSASCTFDPVPYSVRWVSQHLGSPVAHGVLLYMAASYFFSLICDWQVFTLCVWHCIPADIEVSAAIMCE